MAQTKSLFFEDVERGYLMDIPFLMEREQELYEEFYRAESLEKRKFEVYGKSRRIITGKNNGNKFKSAGKFNRNRNRTFTSFHPRAVQYGNKPRMSRKYSGVRMETKVNKERLPF